MSCFNTFNLERTGEERVSMFLDGGRNLKIQAMRKGKDFSDKTEENMLDELCKMKYPMLAPQSHEGGDYPSMEQLTQGEASLIGECIRCISPNWRPTSKRLHANPDLSLEFQNEIVDEQDVSVIEFISTFEPLVLHLGYFAFVFFSYCISL